jgi:hypothetical protein
VHDLVHIIAGVLAPWQSLYSNSKLVSGAVTFVHLAALLFGGGFAVAADRAAFRAMRASPGRRQHFLEDLATVHRPVSIALAAMFASGLLLAAADVETFATSPVFWIKLGLVVLLLGNGYRLTVTESKLRQRASRNVHDPLWDRLRHTAIASVVLWTVVVLAGTLLTSSS